MQTDISQFVGILNKPSLRSFSFEYQLSSRAKRRKKKSLNHIDIASSWVLVSLADLRLYGAERINKNIKNFSLA